VTPAGARQAISRVEVVMPAHNEEHHLRAALSGLRAATETLAQQRPSMLMGITVVLDHCTDRSAEIAERFATSRRDVRVLRRRFRNAGASRAAGAAAALRSLNDGLLETTWLANTDADSRVPANWLVRQLHFADAGWDVVLGSVEPDSSGMDPELLHSWRLRHPPEERHGNVYGANLGVRASAYRHTGGFPPLASSEDRALVDKLRQEGFCVTSTDSTRVVTSGRTVARAPHGFGAYLRTLGVEAAAVLRSS
jgi:glycosyltransferase involved in cell wall biosynthesis